MLFQEGPEGLEVAIPLVRFDGWLCAVFGDYSLLSILFVPVFRETKFRKLFVSDHFVNSHIADLGVRQMKCSSAYYPFLCLDPSTSKRSDRVSGLGNISIDRAFEMPWSKLCRRYRSWYSC